MHSAPMNTNAHMSQNLLSINPPSYDALTSDESSLVNIVQGILGQTRRTQGVEAEEQSAKKLSDYLISRYPEPSSDEPIEFVRKPGESDERCLGRFILQVNQLDPELTFQEVESQNKLYQSKYFLTHFYDKKYRLDIKACKLPDIIAILENRVRIIQHNWISKVCEPTNLLPRPDGWAGNVGLAKNDVLISAGKIDLSNLPHSSVAKHVQQAVSSSSPLCFFRRAPPGRESVLIICTPAEPNQTIGITLRGAKDINAKHLSDSSPELKAK